MRKTCLGVRALIGAMVVAVNVGSAQPPTPPTAQPEPAKNALDNHLVRWEDAMKKVESLAVACTRTEVDAVFKTRKTYTGTIHYVKPTQFFWNMSVKDKPADFERMISTGTYIYVYVPAEKVIRYYPAPKTTVEGKLKEDSSLAFLFGMKAAEAKNRYDLKLHNVDANYVYVDVEAKSDVDKADFTKARLVLNKDTYLPRQIWFQNKQGEILWDLTTVQKNAAIKAEVFAAPQTPKEWKLVAGQEAAKPSVVRPQKN